MKRFRRKSIAPDALADGMTGTVVQAEMAEAVIIAETVEVVMTVEADVAWEVAMTAEVDVTTADAVRKIMEEDAMTAGTIADVMIEGVRKVAGMTAAETVRRAVSALHFRSAKNKLAYH